MMAAFVHDSQKCQVFFLGKVACLLRFSEAGLKFKSCQLSEPIASVVLALIIFGVPLDVVSGSIYSCC